LQSQAYGREVESSISGLLGTSGYGLIAVICVLIVLEELGIPMPFAPGDFLLVLAGVTIATAHVSPVFVVVATYVSALSGAIVGRELFERIGIAALPRIASFLRASGRVDVLTARLRRGGAFAVFAGRITPGMRVVTNQVSGLVAMPRPTFLKGLAPAIAVYEAVFIGLGVWLGPAAWATVEHFGPKPWELFFVVMIVAGCALAGRALVKHIRTAQNRIERLEVQV
jgi:membrane protein DedA with SNARE-associated domain